MARSARVFVVDRDASARNGLARLLRTAGHEVHDCASVKKFLDALDSEAPGLAVLDAQTPGLSAERLHAKLKARGLLLPIIVVSADDIPATWQLAQELKAAAVFRKPVDGRALIDAINWALSLYSTFGSPERGYGRGGS